MIFITIGCSGGGGLPDASFEWFNLGPKEIWVTDVVGIPMQASPGRLTPSRGEDELESTSSSFAEMVRLDDRIEIKWKENEANNWPHGLYEPDNPPGIKHEAEFMRTNFGMPAKLISGKIRFTYLGDDKWRIKYFE